MTVVEKNSFAGGRCSILRTEDGYRFDQGPSLLLLPNLFRETFADLGAPTLESRGVELLKCSPNYNIWFADGELFRATTDAAEMKAEIERWEGPDGFQRYLAWFAEAHAHYHLSLRWVLHKNFTALWQLADPRFVWPALALHPLESIWSRASRYFHSDRLRRVFTFATMYMGMSPFDAPSTYSLLQYTELAEGIWYPRGGFYSVLDELKKMGEELGVEYRLNTPVRRLVTSQDAGKPPVAQGVELENGDRLEADLVVLNADLVYSYTHLLPPTPRVSSYAKSLRARDASCSSISFYWSLSKKVPELGTHNIFLAEQYRESFDAIFKRHGLPESPSFYVNVPSRIDPSAAPAGRDAVIVLVPVGHLLKSRGTADAPAVTPEHQDWPALVAAARRTVLETVQARTGCEPLAPLIEAEMVNDPAAWEAKFNLDKGAILGLSHNFTNVLSFRPRTRPPPALLRAAYFVGASTHPGTGVPIVLAGAKLTAEQILADLRLPVPWLPAVEVAKRDAAPGPGGKRGRSAVLDRLTRPLWVKDTSAFIAAAFAVLLGLLVLRGGLSAPLLGSASARDL